MEGEVMMEKLVTATGIEMVCDYFNPFSPVRQVNIRIRNASVARAAEVFSNPAETVSLTVGGQKLNNYTKLIAIVPERDAVRVVLERE
jgi:hypothetical protein